MCDSRGMTGFLRFLLVLLLAIPAMQGNAHPAEAIPAPVAAMHDMAAHGMARHDMTMHHGQRHDAPGHASHHDCIGCIAPIDISLYRPVRTPGLGPSRDMRVAATAFLLARASAPEPPPPRTAV